MPKTSPAWRRYLRFWGADVEADLCDEFEFHLDTEIEDLVAEGWPAESARAEAIRRFGDMEQFRDRCRRSDERRVARSVTGCDQRYEVGDESCLLSAFER